MSDLKVLFPGEEVTVKGETFTVKPFTFGQLPRAAKLVAGLSRALANSGIIVFTGGTDFAIAENWTAKIVTILSEGGEDLLAFVGFVVGKERPWFDDMDIPEGIALTKAVFQVNIDFFVQRVVPMMGEVMSSPLTGETSSSDSSKLDTDGTTSNDTASPK